MRLLKPLATTALSFAFLGAGAFAQNPAPAQNTNAQSTTQSTTSTDAYGQQRTTTEHHAKKTQRTTLPDGTTVTTRHRTDAQSYDSNGNPITPPASATDRTTTNTQDTVGPNGETHTRTQTHQSNQTTPAPPPPAPPR